MNYSAKIDLENGIFFRAACLGACVLSRGGELVCPAPDACLQVMISVYNAFFAGDNRCLLAEETLAWRDWWAEYKRDWAEVDGPVYTPDLVLELAWKGALAAGGVVACRKR